MKKQTYLRNTPPNARNNNINKPPLKVATEDWEDKLPINNDAEANAVLASTWDMRKREKREKREKRKKKEQNIFQFLKIINVSHFFEKYQKKIKKNQNLFLPPNTHTHTRRTKRRRKRPNVPVGSIRKPTGWYTRVPISNGGRIRNGKKSKSISTNTYKLVEYIKFFRSNSKINLSWIKTSKADKLEKPKNDTIKNKHPIRLWRLCVCVVVLHKNKKNKKKQKNKSFQWKKHEKIKKLIFM